MNKNVVYAILLIAGVCGLVFYALPKYRQVTGAETSTPAAATTKVEAKKKGGEEGL